ncbi:hypothetical protein BJ741DRAFT_712052 [Chytriomyces cf. hyalinus JEL632]|nr:hypothetical protein BJ741DRAFT_712052 [Chytriomyces cf. hyalinus JEL632]
MIANTVGKVTSAVSPFPDVPSLAAVQPRSPKTITTVIFRENEYSLYSHVPRVLTHALAMTRHFKPPTVTGPKHNFFPSPDLVVVAESKFCTASNHTWKSRSITQKHTSTRSPAL